MTNYDVLGVSVTATTLTMAADQIAQAAYAGRPFEVHLCNSFTLQQASRSPELLSVLQNADLNLPDGVPVARLAPRGESKSSLRGPDLMRLLLNGARYPSLRHYIYGGRPEVVVKLVSVLRDQLESNIVGSESPGWGPISDEQLEYTTARILGAGANLVWVGLGTPAQDLVTARLAKRVELAVVPVGAAFDFLSGAMPEAPSWLRGTGLEWTFRLLTEPRRLWKRYLLGNLQFAFGVLRCRVRGR